MNSILRGIVFPVCDAEFQPERGLLALHSAHFPLHSFFTDVVIEGAVGIEGRKYQSDSHAEVDPDWPELVEVATGGQGPDHGDNRADYERNDCEVPEIALPFQSPAG